MSTNERKLLPLEELQRLQKAMAEGVIVHRATWEDVLYTAISYSEGYMHCQEQIELLNKN